MKTLTVVCALALLAVSALAQDEYNVHPSAASLKYRAFREQSTDPARSAEKVKKLIAKIKVDKYDNRTLSDKAFNALTLQEKFAYCMLHGEDFSQNCSAMPPILDEHKKLFGYHPSPFGDEAVWSDRQRDFLDKNRTKVIGLLRETIQIRHRIGVNLKQTITYLKANELIPDVIAEYKRDRKDHDLLTVLMLLMEEAKYKPFMATGIYKTLYGDEANYQAFVPYNSATESQIINLALGLYKGQK